MSNRLTDDPPHHRPGFVWSPEQIAMAEACEKAKQEGGIAAVLVLICTRFGMEGCGGFLREAHYHRQELRKAAADLRHVGGFDDLATMTEMAAEMKPKAPPSWRARLNARHRKRTKELRKKTEINHR
jgi:hypothetical protein